MLVEAIPVENTYKKKKKKIPGVSHHSTPFIRHFPVIWSLLSSFLWSFKLSDRKK